MRAIEGAFPGQTVQVIVLGASDCKFVIPSARAGHRVAAVEVDPLWMDGGTAPFLGDIEVRGLRANIADAAFEPARSVIYAGDCLEDNPSRARLF